MIVRNVILTLPFELKSRILRLRDNMICFTEEPYFLNIILKVSNFNNVIFSQNFQISNCLITTDGSIVIRTPRNLL